MGIYSPVSNEFMTVKKESSRTQNISGQPPKSNNAISLASQYALSYSSLTLKKGKNQLPLYHHQKL